MKNLFFIALSTLTVATACKKDKDSTPAVTPVQVSSALNAFSEIPTLVVATTASGTMAGTYNPTTRVLTYTGLTSPAISGHFHFGAPGRERSSNVFFTFPSPASPIIGSLTLNGPQADFLLHGRIYANPHISNNKAGEIRADLVAK